MSFMSVRIQTYIQMFANLGGFLWEACEDRNGASKVDARKDRHLRVNNSD